GSTFSETNPNPQRSLSSCPYVTRLLAMPVLSFHPLKDAVTKPPKLLDRLQAQAVFHGDTDGDPVLPLGKIFKGDALFLKILLHVKPIRLVVPAVIEDEDDRHGLPLPML